MSILFSHEGRLTTASLDTGRLDLPRDTRVLRSCLVHGRSVWTRKWSTASTLLLSPHVLLGNGKEASEAEPSAESRSVARTRARCPHCRRPVSLANTSKAERRLSIPHGPKVKKERVCEKSWFPFVVRERSTLGSFYSTVKLLCVRFCL